MVTFDCPWCAEPATVDVSSFSEASCERCAVSVEIAADPVLVSFDRAA